MVKFYEGLYDDLVIFVRYRAWLAAVPDIPAQERTVSEAAPVSRIKKMQDEGKEIEMPPLEAGAHLLDYLWEFGPSMAAGMGNSAVTFQEMAAWQTLTAVQLHPWEARMLRRLSIEYVNQAHDARAPKCPAPWTPEEAPALDRQAIAAGMLQVMRAMMKKK